MTTDFGTRLKGKGQTMTKQEMIANLSKAVALIQAVEAAMAKDEDIDVQYRIDANRAGDICIDLCLTLNGGAVTR